MIMSNSQPTQQPLEYYQWRGYQCAYEFHPSSSETSADIPLLLIHPIGVGLSRRFWYRFCEKWQGYNNPIYSPDLLGCGESAKPAVAYQTTDWAEQLQYLIETVIKQPVILVAQGALLPVAIALSKTYPESVRGIVLSGPPAWRVMTEASSPTKQRLLWNLFFDTPVGRLFWNYACREQFLQSFSIKQLFAEAKDVDREWLDLLAIGSKDPKSRYAVFSFLAGFWRQDYTQDMANLTQPTLVVFGDKASSISRSGKSETVDKRGKFYEEGWQKAKSIVIPGRNVLPYEKTESFIKVTHDFVRNIN